MEDILTQRFSFASITPFKDYTPLSEKRNQISTFESNSVYDLDDILSWVKNPSERDPTTKKVEGMVVTLPQKKKRKVFHSATSDPIQERFQVNYLYFNPKTKIRGDEHVFHTTSDRHIKQHYGRQFSSIEIKTIERSIRRHGDVITIKIYTMFKSRGFNCIYFKKNYKVSSISINLKTGNFTTASISKRGKVVNKRFRVNSFIELNTLVNDNPFINVGTYNAYNDEIKKIFDNIPFLKQVRKSLGIEVGTVNKSTGPKDFINDIYKIFIELKKIKIPNGDYEFWITRYYPTEKYLKKNDRKLIASILDYLGIKSKYTIKLLHKYPQIELSGLHTLCSLFGNDYQKYISNINEDVFKNSFRESTIYHTKQSIISNKVNYYLTNREKENLIKLVNDSVSGDFFNNRSIQLITDHFNMINTIREYDPACEMKSRTNGEFHNEHSELSKVISAIKKGWVIEYVFEEKTVKTLEEPIDICVDVSDIDPIVGEVRDTFYPHILKREEEYSEEGSFMHHCVATYANKDKSIIISVRTKDNSDRVTCEYDCQSGQLLQARHFCNKKPPADIEVAIEQLNEKVKKCARLGILHNTEKKKVPVVINGIEIAKKEPTSFLDILLRDEVINF